MNGRPATFAALFLAAALVTSAILAVQMPEDVAVEDLYIRWLGTIGGVIVAVLSGFGFGMLLDKILGPSDKA